MAAEAHTAAADSILTLLLQAVHDMVMRVEGEGGKMRMEVIGSGEFHSLFLHTAYTLPEH